MYDLFYITFLIQGRVLFFGTHLLCCLHTEIKFIASKIKIRKLQIGFDIFFKRQQSAFIRRGCTTAVPNCVSLFFFPTPPLPPSLPLPSRAARQLRKTLVESPVSRIRRRVALVLGRVSSAINTHGIRLIRRAVVVRFAGGRGGVLPCSASSVYDD